MRKIDIIGAGIGGLTTALALEKKGYKPTIYEQAIALQPLGAGIILASNAMQVYRQLGIAEQLKSVGVPLHTLKITDAKLNLLSKVDLKYFKNKYDLQSIAIHRGELQRILVANLKHTELCLRHEVKTATKETDGYTIRFENGNSIQSNLIIGADGIHSKLRTCIVPNPEIRSMKQVCWRGVTTFDLPSKYTNELNEAWGKGDRFAFVQFSKDKIYWYAVKSFEYSKDELTIDQLAYYFKDYAPIVCDIIHKTDHSTLHTAVMEDVNPIMQWYDEYLCLIGDAAHATTPNMGQGACQSIEDAYTIAAYLSCNNPSTAFKSYQEARMSNAHQVVHQSWQIGKISHWKNPLAIFLRNTMLKLIPESVNQAQLEKLFQLQK